MKKNNLESVFAKRLEQTAAKEKEVKTDSLPEDLKEKLIQRFTAEQFKEWEVIFKGRKPIILKVDEFLAVLRPPTAKDLGDYLMGVGTNGMEKAVLMLLQSLWLDGDVELMEDEDNFIAVFLQMNNILEGKKGEFFRL